MTVLLIGSPIQQEEFLAGLPPGISLSPSEIRTAGLTDSEKSGPAVSVEPGSFRLLCVTDLPEPLNPHPGIVLDLLFNGSSARVSQLSEIGAELVMVHDLSVDPLVIPESFVRVNGWPGFLNNKIWECKSRDPDSRSRAEEVLAGFDKEIQWTEPGKTFINARVVAGIIHEAFLAVDERISSPGEIDTAMLLGTGYPLGPFHWAELIGHRAVLEFLHKSAGLQAHDPISILLKEKALAQ